MLKIAIIHGKKPMDGKNLDGKITYLTTDDKEENHIITLTYFLKNHYKDNAVLQRITYLTPIQAACYIFNLEGDIMFIDTTGATPKSDNKIGTFMMPSNITGNQKQGMREMQRFLAGYSDVRIDYDIIYDEGIFDSRTLKGHGKNASAVIDTFLNKIEQEEKEKSM